VSWNDDTIIRKIDISEDGNIILICKEKQSNIRNIGERSDIEVIFSKDKTKFISFYREEKRYASAKYEINVYDIFAGNLIHTFNISKYNIFKNLTNKEIKIPKNIPQIIPIRLNSKFSSNLIFYKEPEVKQIAQDLFEAVFKNKTWKVTQDNKSLPEKVLIFDQEKNELSGADSLKVPYPHFESLQDKMAFLKSLLPRQTLTCEERRQFKLSLGQNCLKEIDE